MNVLTIFEQRIGAIFENGAPGERVPFSFKRLAKRAVREMEDETFVIDGVDTAPALYTILVSSRDDYLMRPMYVLITNEISQLIEAQAKKRGYTFVGKPLVRFMVDPALRGGKFTVFAENIDPRTLARLRDEENAYLGVTPPREIFVEQGFVPQSVPVHEEEPAPIAQEVAFEGENLSVEDFSADLESFNQEVVDAQDADIEPEPPYNSEIDLMPDIIDMPDVVQDVDVDLPLSLDDPVEQVELDEPEPVQPQADEASSAVPSFLSDIPSGATADSPVSFVEDVPAPAPQPPSCTLVNLSSGQTYHITAEYTMIGRERVPGGVVVRDPNASRRHAELTLSGSSWVIRDLRSTNGTLVNDVELPEAVLHDGDVLTIGLTNFEFRESGQ